MKTLAFQFMDLLRRVKQLEVWVEDLEKPKCLWLSGLFNPTAYLTAVMQVTGRSTGLALDKTTIETHITVMLSPTDERITAAQPENGVYVHGLYIEGARWPTGDEIEETVNIGGAMCGGSLTESRLKELLPSLPVVYIKATKVLDDWEASAVGYLRHVDDIYECPVYVTSFRGPTYVFLATLKTVLPKSKWVLTGTAIIMQTDE